MTQLIDHAKTAGFGRLVLNTMPAMHEAVRLYDTLNFVAVDAYDGDPTDGTMYLGLDLT